MAGIRELDPSYFKRYESPYSYKYGSDQMSHTWSLENFWLRARGVWIAVAQTQMEAGLVSREEVEDLIAHRDEVDVKTILLRETDRNDPRYVGHDVVSAISEFSDKARSGGRILHQGMTSEDLLSNTEMLLITESFDLIEERVRRALGGFGDQMRTYKDLVVTGFTHLQAAEPTTFGYRLARYAQDLVEDLAAVNYLKNRLKGKGIKGAVGTSASFTHLLEGTGMTAEEHEEKIMKRLGIPAVLISGQTYPRKFTLMTVSTLALIGQSCYQFANDMKLLQASPFDEVGEPRGSTQVGSSAMVWKENPNSAEGIKSIARSLIGNVVEAWMGAADVTLERGLEDSGGKRSYLPESFLAVDEILMRTDRVIRGLVVKKTPITRNLSLYAPFMAMERVLDELPKRGADRQVVHELLRQKGQLAIIAVREGNINPLQQLIAADPELGKYLSPEELDVLFEAVRTYVGDAPERCDRFLQEELYPAIEN